MGSKKLVFKLNHIDGEKICNLSIYLANRVDGKKCLN